MPDSDGISSILVHMYTFGKSFCIIGLFSVSILDPFLGWGIFCTTGVLRVEISLGST